VGNVPYSPILATLGYVLSPDGTQTLLIHRNTRPDDPAFGKYNGLGGKLEATEDIAAGMRRELLEEAGIHATEMHLRGTISWAGFGKNGEDWFGFIFTIPRWDGTPLTANPEGELLWKPVADVVACHLNFWAGDKYFLPLVFDKDPRPFHGAMPYENGQPLSWNYTR
jgi:8-oxo-dGTP diphosphatase